MVHWSVGQCVSPSHTAKTLPLPITDAVVYTALFLQNDSLLIHFVSNAASKLARGKPLNKWFSQSNQSVKVKKGLTVEQIKQKQN